MGKQEWATQGVLFVLYISTSLRLPPPLPCEKLRGPREVGYEDTRPETVLNMACLLWHVSQLTGPENAVENVLRVIPQIIRETREHGPNNVAVAPPQAEYQVRFQHQHKLGFQHCIDVCKHTA